VVLPIRSFDAPVVSLEGAEAQVAFGTWRTRLLRSPDWLADRIPIVKETPIALSAYTNAGTFDKTQLELAIPQEADACTFELLRPYDATSPFVADGTYEDWQSYAFTGNGDYCLTVRLHYDEDEAYDAADFSYQFNFTIAVKPEVSFSTDRAVQGDIIRVTVDMGFETDLPAIESALGAAAFIPAGENRYEAYVPVGYNQEPSAQDITVSVGGETYTDHVVVTPANFEVERFDMPVETINATMNVPGAGADYQEKVQVLAEERFTEYEKLWEGRFIQPVEGRITSSFGLYRYINGATTPSRHQGIDIAVPTGTPVPASNRGRVVQADFVIMTGNTVVIEHGGGLKTYYYHMSEIDCAVGDMVEQGDIIGLVGSTGYSTGAHLHFEVRIDNRSVSPWPLIDGTSPIYGD
nr:M23 family metallopeptidase [Clostridia bacterium]